MDAGLHLTFEVIPELPCPQIKTTALACII